MRYIVNDKKLVIGDGMRQRELTSVVSHRRRIIVVSTALMLAAALALT